MQSITPAYTVILRDWNFNVIAIFDNPLMLSYSKKIHDVNSFSVSLSARDSRVDLFLLDYFVEIIRSVPGLGITPYREFLGFHRDPSFNMDSDGQAIFTSTGVGLIYILQGGIINYHEGTIRSYKECSSNRAMQEYVEENCTEMATVSNERLADSVIPGFMIDEKSDYGPVWEGDRAFQNLLDVIKDISSFSSIDFDVLKDDTLGKIVFRTYPLGIGSDRTNRGLQSSTGLNQAGNSPVVFARELGNVSVISYKKSSSSEVNIVSVLGEGDGATRHVEVRESDRRNDSPFNRREVSRPYTGFTYEMQVFGDEILNDGRAKEIISITPILLPTSMYGLHYFVGDWITVRFRGVDYHKRIVSVKNTVGTSDSLAISFEE